MIDPKEIQPQVDAGSDVLRRFRYQAEITLPYCLSCSLGSEILSVIPEHLEDIAIECESRWRFIQVKTRNPERGLWRLSDLFVQGGALRSLFRTHKQISEVVVTLELLLEGATKPGDLIENLRSDGNRNDPGLVSAVADKLEIGEKDAISFLDRVVLHKPPPLRLNIKDSNLRLIHEQNSSLTHPEVLAIYEKLISEIERAMRADSLGPEWPGYVLHPSNRPSGFSERLAAKRITRARLKGLVAPLTSRPKHLLQRVTDSTTTSISELERKLVTGGATDRIIERARMLHSNAQAHLFTFQAGTLYPVHDLVEDLNQRLETHVVAKIALYQSSLRPAIDIWDSLLNEFTTNASVIDPNSVMNADPMLLIGHICELADMCVVDWGMAREN